jgi:hypothetical protein
MRTILMMAAVVSWTVAQDSTKTLKEGRITMRASGEFEVKMGPLDAHHPAVDGMQSGRFSIDKTFRGDLEGTSRGEMLSTMTPVKGSAAYVAVEQFRGTLAGRKGSFVLHHYGIMTGGQNRLILEVVPDSGTEELTGLTGTMTIDIRDKKHSYELTYGLPDAR